MKKVYIITDTHFNHKKLIEWGRPVDFEAQIEKGLKILKPEDTLIHLGDICIGRDEEMHERYVKPLPCKKFLAKGNHDNKSYSWYLDHGWDFVAENFKWRYFGKKMVFSHIPVLPLLGCDWNVHGHTHGNDHRDNDFPRGIKDDSFHLDFNLETYGYKPMLLEQFLAAKVKHNDSITLV